MEGPVAMSNGGGTCGGQDAMSQGGSTCGDQNAGGCGLSQPQPTDALDRPAVRICPEAAQNNQRLLGDAHTLEESLEAQISHVSST